MKEIRNKIVLGEFSINYKGQFIRTDGFLARYRIVLKSCLNSLAWTAMAAC